MEPATLLVSTEADWLIPAAVVVGHLTIRMDGVSFRSLIPNPRRSIDLRIEIVESVAVSSVSSREPRALEIVVHSQPAFVFLVPDPRQCARAIEQALAARATRTVYR